MLIDCTYCGGSIIAPADLADNKEFEHERKMKTVNSIVKSFFSSAEVGMNQKGSYVIDLRSSSRRAQKNLGNVVSEIQKGRTSNAQAVFTQSFGIESNDAHKIVDAIGHGKAFDASALRLYPNVSTKKKLHPLVKVIILGVVLIFVVPVVVSLLLIAIALLQG
jgi:hypothetical protein